MPSNDVSQPSGGLFDLFNRFAAITPLGRPGSPDDIEGPAAYLASNASRFHTGDIPIVHGGRTVKSL